MSVEDDTLDELFANDLSGARSLSTTRTPTQPAAAVCDWGASTTVGLVRTRNEDAWGEYARELFVVADGMGGQAGGDLAAKGAVAGLVSTVRARGIDDWRSTIRRLNNQVRTACVAKGFPQAGTAIVAAAVADGRVTVAHVGDCRAYRLRMGHLTCLTNDHTVEAELRTAGIDVRETSRSGLPLFALTRHVGGADEKSVPDVTSFVPQPGDLLLLVSDGVSRQLRPDEIVDICLDTACVETACAETAGAAAIAANLTRHADLAGGRDNATATVVRFAADPRFGEGGAPR